MSRQEMTELVGLGIMLSDPKRLSEVDANCWNGPMRSIVVQLQLLVKDPRTDSAQLRRLIDTHFHIWWEDGKLSDAIVERLKEFGEFRTAQRCGAEYAWRANQQRVERELQRKRERDARGK